MARLRSVKPKNLHDLTFGECGHVFKISSPFDFHELSVPLCVHKYDEDAPRQDRESGTGIAKKVLFSVHFFLGFSFFISKWRTS